MTMHTPLPPDTDELDSDPSDESSPACILVFNASDPSGAGGLTGDIATIASVGGHAIAVVTGAYARDTAQIFDHFCLDDEAVAEQARAVLEDLPVQAIKVGFVGSPENISAIAEIATDYDDVPVIAYMPNLSWWREELIDEYLDAFRELLAAANFGVGRKPQHAVALAAARLEQRPQPHRPRHCPRGFRDGRALHPGHRHSAARAVC